jgi:hypothetical protein
MSSPTRPIVFGLTAIGEVTHLLNAWMMNPCEFKSHLVRFPVPLPSVFA